MMTNYDECYDKEFEQRKKIIRNAHKTKRRFERTLPKKTQQRNLMFSVKKHLKKAAITF